MSPPPPVQLRFASFDLDEANARLLRDGQSLPLTPKAFGVLCALARRPDQLVTKEALLDEVWGHQHVSESVLKTTVSELRAALGDDAKQPRYIETASRRGYRFIGGAPTTTSAARPATPVIEPWSGPATLPEEPRMIGRQPALAKLQEAWAKALSGQRQVAWVVGEAGVGKTRLIREFLRGVDPRVWSHGQCVEQYGAGEPYLPLLEGLGVLCRRDPTLASKLRVAAPTWLMQLPMHCSEADRAALRLELAGATQERMARELREMMDVYTQTQPLLLVTEDLHWSDQATLRLMDYLARSKDASRFLWLASFRLTEVMSGDHPLKGLRHELKLHKLVTEIPLDAFSESEVGEYLADRFPDTAGSERVARRLHRHTEGLPLFLVNVVDDLVEQGTLGAEAQAPAELAEAPLQVPENLAGVIEKQLARLPEDIRDLLAAASVVGFEFRPQAVADAMQRDPTWVLEQCEQLLRRQQWLDVLEVGRLADGSLDARYAFRHALYKRALYQGLGTLTRVQMHHRVAQSMEKSRAAGAPVTALELASHYEQGQDPMAALKHYAEAAENALRHFAPTEALTLSTHAATLLPRCPDTQPRLELELSLTASRGVAVSQLMGVGSPEARAAFEHSQSLRNRLPPAPARASEFTGLGWVLFTRGEYREARLMAARIRDEAGRRGDPVLMMGAHNLMGSSMSAQGELKEGRALLEQAMEICEVVPHLLGGAPFLIAPFVSQRTNITPPLSHLGLVETSQAYMDAALAHARALQDPMSEMLALWYSAMMAWRVDDLERTWSLALELEAKVTNHSLAQGQGPWRWLKGWVLARQGDPAAGYELIMEGLQHHWQRGMRGNTTIVLGMAAEALMLAGRLDEAQQRLDEGMALLQQMGERIYLPDLLLIQARLLEAWGDAMAAHRVMGEALAEAVRQQARWLELQALLARCGSSAASRQDLTGLAALLESLSEGQETAPAQRARKVLVKNVSWPEF